MTNVLSFPSDDGKPRYSIVQVTPDMARRWLDRNIGNRNLRPRKVEKYARDMANGDWAIANDAICFTPDGVLSNGQHRLHAVIASGVTVTMVIGWNIPAESKSVMDTGGGRTPADAMGFHGWKNRVPLAASAKWLILHERGQLASEGSGDITHTEIVDYVIAHPDLHDVMSAATGLAGRIDTTTTALACAMHLIAEHDGFDAARDFFDSLADLVGLEKGDPILAVVSRLRSLRTANSRAKNRQIVDLLIRAYNMRKQGKKVRTIQLQAVKGFVLSEVA